MIVNKIIVKIRKVSGNDFSSNFRISFSLLRSYELDSFEKILPVEKDVFSIVEGVENRRTKNLRDEKRKEF